jgi:hypothetical protein
MVVTVLEPKDDDDDIEHFWMLLNKVTTVDRFQDLIPEGKQRIGYRSRLYNFTLVISLSRSVTKR